MLLSPTRGAHNSACQYCRDFIRGNKGEREKQIREEREEGKEKAVIFKETALTKEIKPY